MLTNQMFTQACAALMCIALAACGRPVAEVPAPIAEPATAEDFSAEALAERALHRRAVEAVIWGMPAVNYDLMLQASIANGAGPNHVGYWSQPLNWKDQTLTPNPDTIYLTPMYDTSRGPVVLEIPAAEPGAVIVGSIDDAWQGPLADVGPAGLDQGKGGKYLITPPGYREKPPAGYFVLPSDTYRGFVILRSNFKSRSAADIATAVDYGKRVKVYLLGAGPDSSVSVDLYDKMYDSTIPYDWRFFESLHRFVQAEPWLTRDKAMIDILKTIGIEKGKPFNPGEKTKAILEQAAREARAAIDLRYSELLIPPFNEGTQWALPASKEVVENMPSNFANPDSYPVFDRGVTYSMAYFSAKQLGTGQFYLMAIKDKAGNPFDGRKNYKLTVPANVPVKQYWSATVYDRETHALIRETSHSSRASNLPELQANADGSVDVYVGPAAPAGKESNWVPSNGRNFEVLFRLYGPQPAFFEKAWKLPDFEELN